MAPRKILIAMDGSTHSVFAFDWYKNNIRKDGDEVLLAYCPQFDSLTRSSSGLMTGNADYMSDILTQEETAVGVYIKSLEDKLKENSLTGRVLRLSGTNPGHAIVKASENEEACLIVTGCRGIGKIRRTLMGSVSQYITHHSHVPVLVCRHD